MKESYGEGVANHTGPESCGVTRKGDHEGLTGESTGQAIEPRNTLTPGCRRPDGKRKATSGASPQQYAVESAAVEEPDQERRQLDRGRGDPRLARRQHGS